MSRYINADTFQKFLEGKIEEAKLDEENSCGDVCYDMAVEAIECAFREILSELKNEPTADVEEVRHGKWIYRGNNWKMEHVFECSVCERWLFTNSTECVVEEYPYCHCGAKMESVEGLEED